MKTSLVASLLALMLGLGVSSVAEAKGHKPEEQALNAILNTAGHDPNLFQSLIDYRNPKAQAAKSPYGALLTPALINRIHTKEKQTVDKICGGHYYPKMFVGLISIPLLARKRILGASALRPAPSNRMCGLFGSIQRP